MATTYNKGTRIEEELNSCLIINYFDEETGKSCLDGLEKDEKFAFMDTVQKQFDKGFKIKINYRFLNSSRDDV